MPTRFDSIWQTYAHNRDVEWFIAEFCRTFWDKPRAPENIVLQPDGSIDFNVVNGRRLYNLAYDPGEALVRSPVWFVTVKNESLDIV